MSLQNLIRDIQNLIDYNQYEIAHQEIKLILDNLDNRSLEVLLENAISSNNIPMVELFLDDIIDPNIKLRYTFSPLENAIRNDNPDMVRILLDRGADPDIRDGFRGNSLFELKYQGHNRLQIFKMLMDAGADLTVKNMYGNTLLHHYASINDYDMVDYLLHLGFDPNVKNNIGGTPLAVAINNKSFKVIKLLIDAGADPRISDKFGDTPFTILQKQSDKDRILSSIYYEVLDILNSYENIPEIKEPEYY